MRALLHLGLFAFAFAFVSQASADDDDRGRKRGRKHHTTVVIAPEPAPRVVRPVRVAHTPRPQPMTGGTDATSGPTSSGRGRSSTSSGGITIGSFDWSIAGRRRARMAIRTRSATSNGASTDGSSEKSRSRAGDAETAATCCAFMSCAVSFGRRTAGIRVATRVTAETPTRQGSSASSSYSRKTSFGVLERSFDRPGPPRLPTTVERAALLKEGAPADAGAPFSFHPLNARRSSSSARSMLPQTISHRSKTAGSATE